MAQPERIQEPSPEKLLAELRGVSPDVTALDENSPLAKMQRVARYIKRIGVGHEYASDPDVIDQILAEEQAESGAQLGLDTRKKIKNRLILDAHAIEIELYKQEFPGHEPPPVP